MLQLQITQHTHSTILFIDVRILILFFFYFKMKWEKRTENSCFCSTLTRVHLGGGSERYFPVTWFSITSKRTKTQHSYLFNCATDQYVSFSLGWIEKKGCVLIFLSRFSPYIIFCYHHFMLCTMEKLIAVRLMTILNPLSADLNQSSPEETQPTGKIIIIITATKIHIERKKTHTKPREQLDDVKFIWNEALLNEVMINDVAWFCWCALFSKLFK